MARETWVQSQVESYQRLKKWYLNLLPNSLCQYISIMARVSTNGPGDLGSIPGRVIPKTQKMVLDASLLNTQHYKVRIKGKVEQSREGVAPSPTPWCSSYRKGSLRVTLDYGRQLYLYVYIHIYKYICVCVCVCVCVCELTRVSEAYGHSCNLIRKTSFPSISIVSRIDCKVIIDLIKLKRQTNYFKFLFCPVTVIYSPRQYIRIF